MLKRTIEEAIPTIRMHFTQEQQDAIENGRRSYHELVNEINKVIGRHLLLSHDFVILSLENYVPSSDEIKNNLKKNVSYFDKEKKYAILKWGILKNNIISDIISEIL